MALSEDLRRWHACLEDLKRRREEYSAAVTAQSALLARDDDLMDELRSLPSDDHSEYTAAVDRMTAAYRSREPERDAAAKAVADAREALEAAKDAAFRAMPPPDGATNPSSWH